MILIRQVTRVQSRSGAVVKHQRLFVVLNTTSNTCTKQLALHHSFSDFSANVEIKHPFVNSL